MSSHRSRLLSWAVAASSVLASPAGAAVFRVFPVTIDAQPGTRAGVLTIANSADQPIALQVRVFRWTQTDGHDVLTPTADVVASPPAMMVPSGQQHVVRVVRTAATPVTGEEAYRLLIDELPDQNRTSSVGVRLLVRQSIPVFFGSGLTPGPSLRWRLQHGAAGWELVATNPGTRRQRIADLQLSQRDGAMLDRRSGLVGYVLAGREARWPVRLPQAWNSPVVVTATSDAGAVHADIASPQAP